MFHARPRAALTLEEQLANLAMLIADRLLGVDGDEVEDERQRLVFPDDPCDEALIALDRIVDVGHVLAGFVEIRHARRRDPFARRDRRHREVEDEVGPQQRLIQLQHPIEIETARDVAREAGEQKPVGNDELPVPERRQDDLLDAMAEIGARAAARILRGSARGPLCGS